jgi:hypothetical protein
LQHFDSDQKRYLIQLLDRILSPEYAEDIRKRVNEDKTQALEYYEPMFEPQTGE